MGLETAATINELVESWPLQADKIRQGAGHLRVIKSALKNTWPGITAPVTLTDEALNQLPTNFTALLTELLNHLEHKGSMKVHDLQNAPIPPGWVLADGHVESGYGTVPDLRDRFVVGAGLSYAERETGGSISKTITGGDHAHSGLTGGHSLTTAEGPNHTHQVWGHLSGVPTGTNDALNVGAVTGEVDGSHGYTSTAQGQPILTASGSGDAHTHPISSEGHTHTITDVRSPYYAVVWIVKVTDFVMPV